MALVPIFRGLVNPQGELRLRETERERRRKWLVSIAGSNVEVIVRREPKQRTLDQNQYIHAVPVALLGEHFGTTIEETKAYLMGECWGWVTGPTGCLVPRIEHTSSMDVEQATYFIEWVGPWALDKFGIEIPLPGEVDYR